MRVILPENATEITLKTYKRYHALAERDDLDQYNFDKRKIEIFTGIPRKHIGDIPASDYDWMVAQIDTALNEQSPFINRVTLNGVEYGFIPNFDKITTAEFVDLMKYQNDIEQMHRLMAILFRPVVKTDSYGNYKIAHYKGTDATADLMEQLPMNIVNGALFFFASTRTELKNYTLRSSNLPQARAKQQPTTSPNGVGMRRLTNWLKGTRLNTKPC